MTSPTVSAPPAGWMARRLCLHIQLGRQEVVQQFWQHDTAGQERGNISPYDQQMQGRYGSGSMPLQGRSQRIVSPYNWYINSRSTAGRSLQQDRGDRTTLLS